MNNKRQEGLERLKALKEAVRIRQEEQLQPDRPKLAGKRGRPKGSKNPNAGRRSKTDLDRLFRNIQTNVKKPFTLVGKPDLYRCGECFAIWGDMGLIMIQKDGQILDKVWGDRVPEVHMKNCSRYEPEETE